MSRSRPPVAAGNFYPRRASELGREVERLLREAVDVGIDLAPVDAPVRVRALIVPHAGYCFSGAVAAAGFRQLQHRALSRIPTVYLIGPAHFERVRSVALAPWECFDTPIGSVPQDKTAIERLLSDHDDFQMSGHAHEPEHCLEVELPFLQAVLERFALVAMLCGEPCVEHIADELEACLGPNDLVVVSSDLSHFHSYEEAKTLDNKFLSAVIAGDADAASQGEACGLIPILILMQLAQRKGWRATLLDYRNSGDTGGDRLRVVGYGAVAYRERKHDGEIMTHES